MVNLPDVVARLIPDAVGLLSLGAIVAGVWGLAGWEWAAIAAGTPPGVFYLWGEVRDVLARDPRRHG